MCFQNNLLIHKSKFEQRSACTQLKPFHKLSLLGDFITQSSTTGVGCLIAVDSDDFLSVFSGTAGNTTGFVSL